MQPRRVLREDAHDDGLIPAKQITGANMGGPRQLMTLGLAPMYPADIATRFDLQPVGVTRPLPLQPASELARKLDWSKPPVVLWQHVMKSKPDATVYATAGGHPAIITRPFGKGKVCFVTIAPLGDSPAGQTAFWDWPQWLVLMTSVMAELTISMTNR